MKFKKILKSNWITYIVLALGFIITNTLFSPIFGDTERLNLLFYSVFQLLTYGIIPSIVIILIFIFFDFIFFYKKSFTLLKYVFQTIIILSVFGLFSTFAMSHYVSLIIVFLVAMSQSIRYYHLTKSRKKA